MIGDSLTFKNLIAIKQAMDKIQPLDRSDYFNNYYNEVLDRLKVDGSDKDQLAKYQ